MQRLRKCKTFLKKDVSEASTIALIDLVEISSLSRVDSDNVLIQFAVLIDGQPMKAVDAAAMFNRLPDLIATLNENLPYQVVKAPSAVVAISLPPLADFTGWLAAVVVLAVLCALLVPLLIFYIKKSLRGGGGGGGVPASQRESRGFKKERTGTSSVRSEVKRHLKDVEKGESENKPLPRPLPAPPRITDALSLSQPTAAPPHSCRPPLTQDSTEKKVNLQTAVSTKMNNRKGSVTKKECNCGDTFEQSAQMNETEEFPKAINIPSRFQSSVVPLPLLKSKRLTVQDSDSDEEVEVSLKKSICAPGKTLSQSRTQVSELKPFADMTDREMQRKADAERQRNKRRLREKQRQSQKTDLGETGMSQRPKAETQETNNKSTKKDEASKRKKNRKDKELAAWKRAQAQNSYGAPPMTAYPTRNGEWPWMNTPQTAFRGPLPYPWQTGPLPNTRHNAEFLSESRHGYETVPCITVEYDGKQTSTLSALNVR
ncbi:hypothetical protein EOD39_1671 [Acipenser ruthenus]|uniref:Uncharacterized protein n=1 Tax=Acipenser ruthenus TaxID=7906 RepID=A0A444U974_ACIRT|nr:hypothetical protein EOD39_1671 [Acipenser ruthenus]